MFKKSRRRIVVSIMSVLVLLWVGTLGVIYGSSYFEMEKQNERMLQTHAQMYELPEAFRGEIPPAPPVPDRGFDRDFDPNSSKFRLSTFYSVALSYEGEVLATVNQPPTVHSDKSLERLAKHIAEKDQTEGTEKNLAFYKMDKGGYILVAFMDNTVINESAVTLLRYTLIFGGVALVLFFFLSVYLAKRIVDPLEKSFEKQKRFVSDAGHELKTPVSVVSANAELLARQIGENKWLSNIQYENERMGILVGQLLTLARSESVSPPMERLDFSRLVAGEALPFESVAYEKELSLKTEIADGIRVEGNADQLKQLVSILLDNAVRHSKDKGEIRLCLKREHGLARLSVTNPGDEIPEEQRERLFERFYRMDSARNSKDGHYGLGLSIAKSIADRHRGRIRLFCHDGLVEFSVEIPAV